MDRESDKNSEKYLCESQYILFTSTGGQFVVTCDYGEKKHQGLHGCTLYTREHKRFLELYPDARGTSWRVTWPTEEEITDVVSSL